ncbi:Protein CBG25947 [Caenorhabditis briggsae]|uniref:Protein CBG25947 n=1 Tax=Caenorhabditis briggsae TaxID=6238 RepID=B6IK79_CAEBR|nr:Protein CBG25947 [Caenorhabditis briggsae]CAS00309.1 Protein CBG25947 [Caenorhabditis briggsae]
MCLFPTWITQSVKSSSSHMFRLLARTTTSGRSSGSSVDTSSSITGSTEIFDPGGKYSTSQIRKRVPSERSAHSRESPENENEVLNSIAIFEKKTKYMSKKWFRNKKYEKILRKQCFHQQVEVFKRLN